MARSKRSLKRRQFRFSLDPMDPVEGEALRLIDKIAEEAKELFEEISDDEADRYAFKRVLLGLLKERPVELQMPARLAQGAAPMSGGSNPPSPAAASAVEAHIDRPAVDLSPGPSQVAVEADQRSINQPAEQAHSAETANSPPTPSWQEELIAPTAKATRHPLAASLAWSESSTTGNAT